MLSTSVAHLVSIAFLAMSPAKAASHADTTAKANSAALSHAESHGAEHSKKHAAHAGHAKSASSKSATHGTKAKSAPATAIATTTKTVTKTEIAKDGEVDGAGAAKPAIVVNEKTEEKTTLQALPAAVAVPAPQTGASSTAGTEAAKETKATKETKETRSAKTVAVAAKPVSKGHHHAGKKSHVTVAPVAPAAQDKARDAGAVAPPAP